MMMRRLRWPILITLLALVVIAALLMRQQPVLTPVIPVVEPASGGIYSEGLIGAFVRLNPLCDYFSPADRDVDRLLFSGLLRFDDRGAPQGDLADSWGISRDGTVYNFSLHPDAVWHDGVPVTSDDVIFTIERMREPGSPLPGDLRTLWQQVEVRRLDDKMLQFRLPEPFSPFLDYLTFGIAPEHLFGDLTLAEIIASPQNLQPVGSGPYKFEQWIVEEGEVVGVALSAFKDYYGKIPFIEQFAFRVYPDAPSVLKAYQDGLILGIGQVSEDIMADVFQDAKLNLHTGRLPEMSLIFMNMNNPQMPFFKDAAVRRALLMGLNRQRIIDQALNGQAFIADGPIFPGTWAYYEDIERVEYSQEEAISLLKKAGYTIPAEGGNIRTRSDSASAESSVALAFELLYVSDELHQKLAEAIQRDWVRLGVGVTLKAVTSEELINDLDSRAYQAALADINLFRSPDPDPYPFWHQAQVTGGQNYAGWDDRQASEYLEQARVTTDQTERVRLYRNFQVRFSQELPALLLYYPVYRYAVDVEVQGVRVGPLFEPSDRFATVANWYLVTKSASGATQTPIP